VRADLGVAAQAQDGLDAAGLNRADGQTVAHRLGQVDELGQRLADEAGVGRVEDAGVGVDLRDAAVVLLVIARAALAAVRRHARVARHHGVAVHVEKAHADHLRVRRDVLGEVTLQAVDLLLRYWVVAEAELDDVAGADLDVGRAAPRGGAGLGVDHCDGRRRDRLGGHDLGDTVGERQARDERAEEDEPACLHDRPHGAVSEQQRKPRLGY
jgi:hypothetical protein